jgi:MFS family permease
MKVLAWPPLLSNRLKLFMATMILANIAGNMHHPLLPLYLQELGAGVGQVGLFFTLSSVAPLLFQIFGGWLSDAIGRLAGILAYVVYVMAPSWGWLLLATVAEAMTRSFVARATWPSSLRNPATRPEGGFTVCRRPCS